MDMYATGEIEEVLKSFEKALELNNVYIGCKIEKSEKETKVLPNGRIKKIYRTHYDNGICLGITLIICLSCICLGIRQVN